MYEFFKKYGIKINEEQKQKFDEFLKIFIKINSQTNLSSIRDEIWIIEKHFIDSIILTKFYLIEWKVLDLWTGWWFPWIPLKIINTNNADFTLVDSIWKKIKCVNTFINKLWLTNIKTIQLRAEKLWHDINHRWKYNTVFSRATAYLPTLLEYAIPLLKIWWTFISYKLDNDNEIIEANNALHVLNAKIIKIQKYELAGQKRIFLFIKKIWETNKKYPRTIWEPLKNPIK